MVAEKVVPLIKQSLKRKMRRFFRSIPLKTLRIPSLDLFEPWVSNSGRQGWVSERGRRKRSAGSEVDFFIFYFTKWRETGFKTRT